jgi:ABC-type sulfate transport system permease component
MAAWWLGHRRPGTIIAYPDEVPVLGRPRSSTVVDIPFAIPTSVMALLRALG